jgi:hypothetical protein
MRYEAISETHNFLFLKIFWSKTTVNPYQKTTAKIGPVSSKVLPKKNLSQNQKFRKKNPKTYPLPKKAFFLGRGGKIIKCRFRQVCPNIEWEFGVVVLQLLRI